jgi:16S rRNA (uracil1498-N3)-methyltransferase
MSVSSSPLRLYVPDDLGVGLTIPLPADQSRYVVQVMRRTVGDPILLFNGRDGEWQGEVERADKKATTVALSKSLRPQTHEPNLWLLFAPAKRTATDLIVQKATELGVTALVPVITTHTNKDRVRAERLTSIAVEAAEQSRRLTIPEIRSPVHLTGAFTNWPDGYSLYVLDETGTGAPIAQVLADFKAQQTGSGAFVMGPEGGFTETELDLLRALPFSTFVSLGPRILRAETAALAALTCWQALCGDWCNSIE